jgi:hypothetical protein
VGSTRHVYTKDRAYTREERLNQCIITYRKPGATPTRQRLKFDSCAITAVELIFIWQTLQYSIHLLGLHEALEFPKRKPRRQQPSTSIGQIQSRKEAVGTAIGRAEPAQPWCECNRSDA